MKNYVLTILLLLNVSTSFGQVQEVSERLVIADKKGDWGLLAPYLHMKKGPGYVYTSFLFDTLVWKDQSGSYKPMLATSWKVDEQFRCYDFTINEQAQWHDGVKLTARDIVFSFNYMKKHFYQFVDLSGIESVVDKDNQVSICSEKSNRFFIERIAGVLPIIPKHIYQGVNDPKHFSAENALIGSGPYKLKKYDKTQGFYFLERNDNWYLGKPKYKEVVVTKLSPQAAANAMKKGKVDIVSIPYDFIELFEKSGAKIVQGPSNHPYRLLFQHALRFENPILRQAIAYSIDQEELVTLAYHNHAEVARPAFMQTGTMKGLNNYEADSKKASDLFVQAGWKKTEKGRWLDEHGKPITLSLIAPSTAVLLSKVIASQLDEVGIKTNIRLLPDVPFLNMLTSKAYDLALVTQSHQGDVDRFRLMLTGKQVRGDHYISNSELLSLLDDIETLTDSEEINKKFLQAEIIYNRELPSLPLVNPTSFNAVTNTVTAGFTPNGIAMGIPMILNKTHLFLIDKSQ